MGFHLNLEANPPVLAPHMPDIDFGDADIFQILDLFLPQLFLVAEELPLVLYAPAAAVDHLFLNHVLLVVIQFLNCKLDPLFFFALEDLRQVKMFILFLHIIIVAVFPMVEAQADDPLCGIPCHDIVIADLQNMSPQLV